MKDFNRALNYSFLLLRYRARAKAEIAQRLKKKKYSSAIIKQATRYLEENKYINDEEFVKLFTSGAVEKGWGPRKVIFRLKQLGISQDVAKLILASKAAFKARLRQTIKEKTGYFKKQKPSLSSGKIGQKVMRFLLARGFSCQDINKEMNDLGWRNKFEDS